MDGLESAMAEAGSAADPAVLDKTISALDSRVFLMHNVNLRAPVVFTTRWAMSYLRGPLTRQQIKTLMAGRKTRDEGPKTKDAAGPSAIRVEVAAGAASTLVGLVAQPPVLPPGIKQVYLPVTMTEAQSTRAIADRSGGSVSTTEKRLVYEPAIIGIASVQFTDRKLGVDESQDYSLLLPADAETKVVSWKNAHAVKLDPRDLESEPVADAFFVPVLPEGASNARAQSRLATDLTDHLYRTATFDLLSNPTVKLHAHPGESERDFRIRCQQAAREQRDTAIDALRKKYAPKVERIEDRLAREERELAEDKAQYQGRIGEEVLSGLSTVAKFLGVTGRKSKSLSGLSTAASKRRITSSAKADIAESEAEIARLKADVEALNEEMEREIGMLTQVWTDAVDSIQPVQIAAKKTNIDVQMVALAWTPTWEVTYEDARGRSRTDAVPAYEVEQA
jgi:hypothetical protein